MGCATPTANAAAGWPTSRLAARWDLSASLDTASVANDAARLDISRRNTLGRGYAEIAGRTEMALDSRIARLNPWQREVYRLAWSCGLGDKSTVRRLEDMKKERPVEFEEAMRVWDQICLEVMN